MPQTRHLSCGQRLIAGDRRPDGTDRAAAPRQSGYVNLKPCSSNRAGTTRRLFRMSSVSVRMKTAPISSIHLFAGRPKGTPQASRSIRMNSALGKRIRRRDVHDAVDVIALDQPPNRCDEVLVVNPRHELPAVAGAAAEAAACQPEERVEHASRVRTQGHRRPKRHLPSAVGHGFVERALPRTCDVDAESPGAVVRSIRRRRECPSAHRSGCRIGAHRSWRCSLAATRAAGGLPARSPVRQRASTTRATAGSPLD